jgi:hypothetical protein
MQTETTKPSTYSRQPKLRPCRGCGEQLLARVLHVHEMACLRARVLPGQRFWINADTTVGGRANKHRLNRPIEVEVIRPQGKGWLVRAIESGREIAVKTERRFVNWDQFKPGLRKKGA